MTKVDRMLMTHQHDPFDKYKTFTKEAYSGIQKEYQFDNGYGASVICHKGSYGGAHGLWEVAVTWGSDLCYDTEITDSVLGHLSTDEVNKTLKRIKDL